MNLTPLDIRRKEFDKGFRGYDPTEVDLFLKQVAQQMEELQEEVRRAGERARDAEAKLTHYEKVELALQEALESARETARSTAAASEEKARLIVQDAELRADAILRDAERERHGLRQDIVRLSSRQAEAAARLRGFLMSELEVLAQFQGDEPAGFLRLQPATSASGYAASPARLEAPMSEAPEPWDADAAPGPDAASGADATWAAGPEPSAPELSESEPTPRSTPPEFELPEPEPEPPYEAPGASGYDPVSFAPVPADSTPSNAGPYEPPYEASSEASSPSDPEAFTPSRTPFGPAETPADPPQAPDAADPDDEQDAPFTGAYASATDRSAGAPAGEAPTPPAVTGGWDLRSLVTGEERSVVASDEERDRIRRILDDLD